MRNYNIVLNEDGDIRVLRTFEAQNEDEAGEELERFIDHLEVEEE